MSEQMMEIDASLSWNDTVIMRLMISELQRQVEASFKRLSKKYHLQSTLLFSHNYILQCLYFLPEGASLTEIGRHSGQNASNVSVAAKTLEENGLIERHKSQNDSRRYVVSLTDLGRDFCKEYIKEDLSQINAKLYDGVSKELLEANHKFFKQIDRNLQKIRIEESSYQELK